MQLSDWIPGWIAYKNWQIRGTFGYLVLTETQTTAWQPWFVCPPCKCLLQTPHNWGTEPRPDEIDISLSWRIVRTSWVVLEPIVQLRRDQSKIDGSEINDVEVDGNEVEVDEVVFHQQYDPLRLISFLMRLRCS